MRCTDCGFVGDPLQLYMAVNDLKLSTAVAKLRYAGILDESDDFRGLTYRSDLEFQEQLRPIWVEARKSLSGSFSSIRGLFQSYRINFSNNDVREASRWLGVMYRKMLEPIEDMLPKSAKRVLNWWGRYNALALPCYDRWEMVGIWLFRPVNGKDQPYMFLPLRESYYNGLSGCQHLRVDDEQAVICDDPEVGLRYTLRQVPDGRIKQAFIIPAAHGEIDEAQLGYLPITWFSPDRQAPTLKYAMQSSEEHQLVMWQGGWDKLGWNPHSEFGPRGKGRTSRSAIKALLSNAQPVADAVVRHLLDARPLAESRDLARQIVGQARHRSRLLALVTGPDEVALAEILEHRQRARTVDIDGQTVVERPDGWWAGRKKITDVTFTVRQMVMDGRQNHVCHGQITFQGQTWDFSADYQQLRKNTARWLEDQVLANPGRGWPAIVQSWSNRLLRIANEFDPPERVQAGLSFGWANNRLSLPLMAVSNGGITPGRTGVSGPMIAPPQEPTAKQLEDLQDSQVCEVLLVLSGNICRTRAGLPGLAVALMRNDGLVQDIADGLLWEVQIDPSDALLAEHVSSPFPLPTAWTGDLIERPLASQQPPNAILSVDPQTHRQLLLREGWVGLACQRRIDPQLMRLLPWVAHWLARADLQPTDDRLYGDIADALRAFLADLGIRGTKLQQAGRVLDRQWRSHQGNAGSMILRRLYLASLDGELQPEATDERVSIAYAELEQACNRPGLSQMPAAQLALILAESNMLLENKNRRISVSRMMWDIYASDVQSV